MLLSRFFRHVTINSYSNLFVHSAHMQSEFQESQMILFCGINMTNNYADYDSEVLNRQQQHTEFILCLNSLTVK